MLRESRRCRGLEHVTDTYANAKGLGQPVRDIHRGKRVPAGGKEIGIGTQRCNPEYICHHGGDKSFVVIDRLQRDVRFAMRYG